MKLQVIFLCIFMLKFCATMTVGQTFSTSSSNAVYPRSGVDLIVNFFKTYKHIKRLTLFLCDHSSSSLSFADSVRFDYNRMQLNASVQWQMQNDKPNLKQKHEPNSNCCLNFQQIVKCLMASGNFLINGYGNIDATMFTTSGYDCSNDVEYENFDSVAAHSLPEMLKSGDFRQGVVLDLRCQHSRHILQQVNNDPNHQKLFSKHFVCSKLLAFTLPLTGSHIS